MDDILDRPSTPSSNYRPAAAAQPSLPNPPPLSMGGSSHQSGVATPVSSGSKVSAAVAGGCTWNGPHLTFIIQGTLFCIGLVRMKSTFQMLVCDLS